jgi:integrase
MSVWIDKKTGKWKAKFKHENRQYKKEGFDKRASGLTWEVEKRQELNQPIVQKEIPLTFAETSTCYLEDCKKRFQKNTWRQKAYVYRSFLTYLSFDPPITQISKSVFVEYLKSRSDVDGNKACNRDLKEFNALYNWLIRNDFEINNPCRNIQKYPESQFVKYIPPSEDLKKVLLAADPNDTDLLLVLFFTAGRIGEILRLTWEDINFERKTIRLFTRKRKGGGLQFDQLPINEDLYKILNRRWIKRYKNSPYVFSHPEHEEPIKYGEKRYIMSKLCKKAKVKHFGFHAIRHHVASILLDSGKVSISEIQVQLRHKKPTTTDSYLHTLDPKLRRVANILEDPLKNNETDERGTAKGTISDQNKIAQLKKSG